MADYDASSIEVLEEYECVQRRPGMYVGNTRDGTGLLRMVEDVVDEAVYQYGLGRADTVRVTVEGPTITVGYEGQGLPVDPMDPSGRSPLERLFCHFHRGFGATGRRCTIGPVVANALSERFEVESRLGGRRRRQAFARGRALGPVREAGPAAADGTTVRFTPDRAIFGEVPVDRDAIAVALRRRAYCHPGLELSLNGHVFWAPAGLVDLVADLAEGAPPTTPTLHGTCTKGELQVDVAFGWRGAGHQMASFVGDDPCRAGSHVRGVWAGLVRAVRTQRPLAGVFDAAIAERLRPGLHAGVRVALPHPSYDDQRRDSLRDDEVEEAVATLVARTTAASEATCELLKRRLH